MTDEHSSEETALAKPEVTLETMSNAHGTGTLMRARGKDGKFVPTTHASAELDAYEGQKFLQEIDPNTNKTRKASLREALYDKALKANDKSLGAAVKVVEFFENESGHTKAKEEMLRDDSHVHQTLRVVMVPIPTLMNPDVVNFEEEQKRKLEEKNRGPAFLEVVDVRTNE